MTASGAHAVVRHAKAALAKGAHAQLAELDGTSVTMLDQVTGASAELSAAVGGQRDHLLGAIDAAIGEASTTMAASLTDMTQQIAGYRAAAVMTYVAAETQIIAGAQPEIAKAQGEWRGKADEFVASCTAYETEAVGKYGEVSEGAPPVSKPPVPTGEVGEPAKAGEPAKTGQQGEPPVEEPPRRGQCFVPGTPVHTPRGMVPIEQIAVGDDVFGAALDTPGTQATVARVTQVFARRVPEVLDLDFGDEIVTCSPEHPFHVAGGGWRTAGALVPGTTVTSREGPAIALVAVTRRAGDFAVHNIEVDAVHDYFVGRLGLLVHNKPMMSYEFHAEQLARRASALRAEVPGRAELIAEAEALAKEAKKSPGEDLGDKLHDLDTRISVAEIPTASDALAARAASLAERASKLPMKSATRWALIEAAKRLQADAKALGELSRETPPDREMLSELDGLQRRWAELEHDVTAEEPAPVAPKAKTVWERRLDAAKWDDHGHKHTQATTDAEAEAFSTPTAKTVDPASQYLPEVDVPALEREALENGTVYKGDPNTPGSTVFLRYDVPGNKIIGYDGGKPVSTMRVEITAGDAFHGHPRDFTKGM